MAQNEPQRKETPPGPSPNSPPLLFEYQCRSGKFIRLANRIESKKSIRQRESNRIESKLFARIGMLYSSSILRSMCYLFRKTSDWCKIMFVISKKSTLK